MLKYFKFLIIPVLFILIATPVCAMDWSNFSIVPDNCRNQAPDRGGSSCQLDDLEQAAVNISMLIMSMIGAVTLLMFVIGGFLYMTSGGAADKIKKATSVITNAVIGMAIVLLSGAIIKILIKTLTTPTVS